MKINSDLIKKSFITMTSTQYGYTLQTTGIYEVFPLNVNKQIGTAFSYNSDGTVTINDDIEFILVSAFSNVIPISNDNHYISIDNLTSASIRYFTYKSMTANISDELSITPVVLKVNKGDTIALKVYGSQGSVFGNGIGKASLTLEAIY